jgi:DNA invertase Pin-like site-specific DNA recombinase
MSIEEAMTQIAYIRVSSVDQNTDRQLADLKNIEKTFSDKCSGGTTNRPGLTALLEFIREGDVVHVHSIDRLARNLQDLLELVQRFRTKGVTLQFHKESMTFKPGTSDPMQDLMLNVMGAVAQFEKSLINERQREGIAKAKAQGVYSKARSKKVEPEAIQELLAQGKSHSEIAKSLGCSTKTVQRVKNQKAEA